MQALAEQLNNTLAGASDEVMLAGPAASELLSGSLMPFWSDFHAITTAVNETALAVDHATLLEREIRVINTFAGPLNAVLEVLLSPRPPLRLDPACLAASTKVAHRPSPDPLPSPPFTVLLTSSAIPARLLSSSHC